MSYTDDNAHLMIAEAFSEDEGDYTCYASNTAGTAKTSCRVKVNGRSQVIYKVKGRSLIIE